MTIGDAPAMPLDYDLLDKSNRGLSMGLTKREYFAAKAMQGLVSDCRIDNGSVTGLGSMSKIAVSAADALIKELNKTEKQ